MMMQFIAGLIGSSQAQTYNGLMVTRVISCFGSGVCEALPVQLVNDIFFLHERGKYIGFYTCEPSYPWQSLGSRSANIDTRCIMFRPYFDLTCRLYALHRA